jgi:hypothetical protein
MKKKRINISLEKPFIDKMKYLTKKTNKKYSQINTYPFNFENLKLLSISKIKKNKKKSRVAVRDNFKKKIPIKYNHPNVENDLIKIYENIHCNIKVSDIIEYNTKNKSIFNSHFRRNIKMCTKYVNDNVNYLINQRIIELQKNRSEQNYYNISDGEINFNVLFLNNNYNSNLFKYNPLNNYSIAPVKTEPNIFRIKDTIFKKNYLYNNTSKEEKKKSKEPSIPPPLPIKKHFSLENIIKEKSNNILFDNFSCMGEISNEIYDQNEKELKSYLNLIYLKTQLHKKTKELSKAIQYSQNQIETNVQDINSKMYELIDNVHNIPNISNNITNNITEDIIMHDCQKNFEKIKLLKTQDKINEIKNKFELDSIEVRKDNIKVMKLKENYRNKIMKLKDEIETLNNQIKNNEEAGIKY